MARNACRRGTAVALTLRRGSDGHWARQVSPWNAEKLYYLDRYLDIFTTGMKEKWEWLVYADLLAGPGICVEEGNLQEALGSPLLALKHGFHRLLFNDADARSIEALKARTVAVSHDRLKITHDDCNHVVGETRTFLLPPGTESSTLALAFVDPTGFQVDFETIRKLSQGIRMDLLIVFMTGFVRRFRTQRALETRLTAFIGNDEWKALLPGLRGEDPFTFGKLLELYRKQLRTIGYRSFPEEIRVPRTGPAIYHLVFASKHALGGQFFEKISSIRYGGQRKLDL